jgi:hypothetical protein
MDPPISQLLQALSQTAKALTVLGNVCQSVLLTMS